MSVGPILSRTTAYLFRKLNFDYPFWSTYEHQNWDDLDLVLQGIAGTSGVVGAWTNSIPVLTGEKYVDTVSGTAYLCLVNHTTAAAGTFSDERTAQPTYWSLDAVANNSITMSKIQDVVTQSFIGRNTAGTGDPEVLTAATARTMLGTRPHGQCQLNYLSTTSIKLSPFDGDKLMIGDVPCSVPSAGVTLAPTGLTANTDYYIFATDANSDGIVDTLEASLVSGGTQIDTTTGVKTKSGDRTRTLVAITRPIAGPLWEWASRPYVRSYFNRQKTYSITTAAQNRTFTNTGAQAEIHTTLRAEFIAFADDRVIGIVSHPISNSAANDTTMSASFNGTTNGELGIMTGTSIVTISKSLPLAPAADGYNYLTVLGAVAAGTGTIGKSASSAFGRNTVIIG